MENRRIKIIQKPVQNFSFPCKRVLGNCRERCYYVFQLGFNWDPHRGFEYLDEEIKITDMFPILCGSWKALLRKIDKLNFPVGFTLGIWFYLKDTTNYPGTALIKII